MAIVDYNNPNDKPPVDYDQSRVPQEIKDRSDGVRHAKYGSQNKEFLAQNAEIAGIYAGEAKRIAEQTQYRQDAVEDFNTQVIQEMTDKDVISSPEIIQMRDGEATANARLDRDFSKKVNKGDLVINAADYGLVADNITDNATALSNAFADAMAKDARVYIPAGKFYTTEPWTVYHRFFVYGAGIGKTTIRFAKGVNFLQMQSGVRNPVVKELTVTTESQETLPEAEWIKASAFKFDDTAGGSEAVYQDIEVNNFYIGLEFKDYMWANSFRNVRFNRCGHTIYNHDCFTHTNIQNVFEKIYSNNPVFGAYRLSSLQATFIESNFGSSDPQAYFLKVQDNANIVFENPNFEEVYISADNEYPIEIKNRAKVTFNNPSFKDLKTHLVNPSVLSWMAVRDNAEVQVSAPVYIQNDGKPFVRGTVFNRGVVKAKSDLPETPQWLLSNSEPTYRQQVYQSDYKVAKSSPIVLKEAGGEGERHREILFTATSRAVIHQAKALYMAPHASGYGELEIYQLSGGSKIKLANIAVVNSTNAPKNTVVELNIQVGKVEPGIVYVGGFGLGTLQALITYTE